MPFIEEQLELIEMVLLSDLSNRVIAELEKKNVASGTVHPKEAKKQLARELTAWFHRMNAAIAAEHNLEAVFMQGGIPGDIPEYVYWPTERVNLPRLLADASLVKYPTSEVREG